MTNPKIKLRSSRRFSGACAGPCRRATKPTIIPGSKVSSTIRTFSEALLATAGRSQAASRHQSAPREQQAGGFVGYWAKRPWKPEILKEALEHATGSKNVWPAPFARGLCKVV